MEIEHDERGKFAEPHDTSMRLPEAGRSRGGDDASDAKGTPTHQIWRIRTRMRRRPELAIAGGRLEYSRIVGTQVGILPSPSHLGIGPVGFASSTSLHSAHGR